MMQKLLLLLVVLLLFVHASAQSSRIGQWRYYLPYNQVTGIAENTESIFLSFKSGLLVQNKEDHSIRYYSKLNRLSDFGCATIGWNETTQTLLVTYDNGNMDLLTPDASYNVVTLKNAENLTGNRSIRHITHNDSIAYLSADFGLSKFDLAQREFVFTTFTPMPILQTALYEGRLYAATEEGVYSVSLSDANPADFGNWELLASTAGLPGDYRAYALAFHQDRLFIGTDKGLYAYQDSAASLLSEPFEDRAAYLLLPMQDGSMHMITRCSETDCNPNLWKITAQPPYVVDMVNTSCLGHPTAMIESEGRIWLADEWSPVRRINLDYSCDNWQLNTPTDNKAFRITLQDDDIYLASGAIGASGVYSWFQNGVYVYENQQTWRQINENDFPGLGLTWDYVKALADPIRENTWYFATYSRGLIRQEGDQYVLFDQHNSALGPALGDNLRTRVSDIAFDTENNLWIANHNSNQPICVLTPEDEWHAFRPPTSSINPIGVHVDQQNYKWYYFNTGNTAIVIFDEGEDLATTGDDRYRTINSNNTELSVNSVLSVTSDLDGSVWIGTTDGAFVLDRCADPFEDICTVDRRIVEVDGIPAYLLETESVNAIAIDGANRKWFGTNNGIFVQSADGTEQVADFNENNSPLPSNIIKDIKIRMNTGEVFIATDKGLVSYQSDATSGGIVNSKQVSVYPNPVRPDYEGPIAIKGLAQNAQIKITDLQGRLVNEFRSTGGQAIWNGRDYQGRRVVSGVYLVYSTADRNLTNPDAIIAKIVVIGNDQ